MFRKTQKCFFSCSISSTSSRIWRALSTRAIRNRTNRSIVNGSKRKFTHCWRNKRLENKIKTKNNLYTSLTLFFVVESLNLVLTLSEVIFSSKNQNFQSTSTHIFFAGDTVLLPFWFYKSWKNNKLIFSFFFSLNG